MSKVFVLRTHALLSSRRSTLKFGDDNEIVIPLAVVDELKSIKFDSGEKKRISRELLEYINSFPTKELMSESGVEQENGSILRVCNNFKDVSINTEGLTNQEIRTLQTCLGIMNQERKNVILVTNNLSLQLKAKFLGIKAESFKDETFPRLKEQYTGREEIYTTDDCIDYFYENGFIEIEKIFEYSKIDFITNKFFVLQSESKSALGRFKNGKIVALEYQRESPYDIKAKNVGQKFLLEALLDDSCSLVVVKGNAGTGKTFCTLAAGLEQVQHKKKYTRILVTRSVTATGEERYGFLPGDIEEKLSPYLAGIKDNLAILVNGTDKEKRKSRYYEDGTIYFESGIVQIQAIGF